MEKTTAVPHQVAELRRNPVADRALVFAAAAAVVVVVDDAWLLLGSQGVWKAVAPPSSEISEACSRLSTKV